MVVEVVEETVVVVVVAIVGVKLTIEVVGIAVVEVINLTTK